MVWPCGMANIKVEDSFFSIAREIKTRLTSGGAAGGVPEPAIKLGRAVQVDPIKTRFESAYAFSA